jgi:hypothetical protein
MQHLDVKELKDGEEITIYFGPLTGQQHPTWMTWKAKVVRISESALTVEYDNRTVIVSLAHIVAIERLGQ